MGAPSFTLEIELKRWAVGKSDAAVALLRAFEEAGDQRFPDESRRKPSELAMATIEMDEERVVLRAVCRMAPYESVAEAMIEGDGGIQAHVAKRSGPGMRLAAWWLGLLGRIDWASTRQGRKERMAKALAASSAESLRQDAQENIKSMEAHLGIA
jgi:replicative DNA helicase